MYSIGKKWLYVMFGMAVIAYVVGLIFPVIMDIDASQYAAISMQMIQDKALILMPKFRFDDYLDKPPLLFWASALSMGVFGMNEVAYRLPSFLSTFLGAYSTYRLGKSLYTKNAGIIAAIILAANQAYFLINHDVRTDTMLANFMALASWQLVDYLKTKSWKNLIWTSVGIGLSLLEKGPIGLMVPVAAFGGHLLIKKDFKSIFDWKYIPGLVIVGIMLAPMTWGLYEQWGWKGIRFYYWTQSFGRITGESGWRNDAGWDFFLHTFLWSFLPWSLVAIYAYVYKIRQIVKKNAGEYITIIGFTFVMFAMSMSNYKLPHYIYVAWTFIAVITGAYLDDILTKKIKNFKLAGITLYVSSMLLLFTLVALIIWSFPNMGMLFWVVIVVAVAGISYIFFAKKEEYVVMLLPAVAGVCALNIVLNGYFYPQLGKYQSGSLAGKYILKHQEIPRDKIYHTPYAQNSFDFYSQQPMPVKEVEELIQMAAEGNYWVLLNKGQLKELENAGVDYGIVKSYEDFHITTLNATFLNKKTRDKALLMHYLIEVRGMN